MRRLKEEDFIAHVKEIHGDLYDYSEVKYVNARTKVKLFCKKHNIWFEVTPSNILSKKCGCPICRYEKSAKKMSMSIEDFIKRANEVHNFKYDYSKVEYVNNRTKVCIICPTHGEFWQTPEKHIIRGHGCPHCGGSTKRTTESFINDAKKVHGDKYDYSKVEYTNIRNKVCIICPIHGEFLQRPSDHLKGQGCPKCKMTRLWDTRGRLTVEDVKKKFHEIHGDEYDYSLFTEYKNNHTKIPIICYKHGVFEQTAMDHLSGSGCPKCKGEKASKSQRLPIEEVIKRIKDVHGGKYIIPNDFDFKNIFTKVKLICKEHGEFWCEPVNLFKGVGCPQCNNSKLENEISLFLKENNIEFIPQKKFDWLGNYELDFYLPNENIAIECQGKQHFKAVELFGGEKQFEIQRTWDEDKFKKCQENGVNILYFTNGEFMKYNDEYFANLISDKELLLEEIKRLCY